MPNMADKESWAAPLAHLGAVRVQGADTIRFLQGQLSNDLALLGEEGLLAGFHNPQGRTIAVLRLALVGPDDVLAILPRELAAQVATRLSRYVLRAKVRVTEASADWQVIGVVAEPGSESLPEAFRASPRVLIARNPSRWIVARNVQQSAASVPDSRGDPQAWHALDIAAGLPQVYQSTSEAFVAQMLNLDLLDGVSFTKGCYTGQEVIARAHYRGRVKRRMQRFRAARALSPGEQGTLRDGRGFKVVDSVLKEDGTCEFLAVAPLAPGAEASDTSTAESAVVLDADQLDLPYALPE